MTCFLTSGHLHQTRQRDICIYRFRGKKLLYYVKERVNQRRTVLSFSVHLVLLNVLGQLYEFGYA